MLITIVMLLSLVGVVFFATTTLEKKRPEIDIRATSNPYNPYNLLFSENNFTHEGKKYRKGLIISLLSFFVSIVASLIFLD